MLNKAELLTSGGKTELVFSFNTDGGTDTVKVDVTSLLNGTELQNLQLALDTHVNSATTMHFSSDERANFEALIQNYSKTKLDTKFNEINSALTANTQAHSDLSSEIASAKTDITAVSGVVSSHTTAIDEINSSITENYDEFTAHTSSANTKFSTIETNINNLSTANTEAHKTLQGNIEKVESDYKAAVETLTQKVNENEEVIAASLTDLKENKVSSVIAEEESNIVVNEVKNENGISYTIDLQWLTF